MTIRCVPTHARHEDRAKPADLPRMEQLQLRRGVTVRRAARDVLPPGALGRHPSSLPPQRVWHASVQPARRRWRANSHPRVGVESRRDIEASHNLRRNTFNSFEGRKKKSHTSSTATPHAHTPNLYAFCQQSWNCQYRTSRSARNHASSTFHCR